jgi:hypothetical protein
MYVLCVCVCVYVRVRTKMNPPPELSLCRSSEEGLYGKTPLELDAPATAERLRMACADRFTAAVRRIVLSTDFVTVCLHAGWLPRG